MINHARYEIILLYSVLAFMRAMAFSLHLFSYLFAYLASLPYLSHIFERFSFYMYKASIYLFMIYIFYS